MLLRDKLFCGLMVLLAMGLMLAMSFWHAVGVWPEAWLVKRAWRGDDDAIGEMVRRSRSVGDLDSALYWMEMLGEPSEREILFMGPESRRIMKKLFEAQGRATPLLDAVGE